MKRLTLILGAAAIAVISAPVSSATAQTGCSWWDIACRGMTNTIADGGWHVAGRDASGNVIYVRRRLDANGNVIVEQSRRSDLGGYRVLNSHVNRKGTYIGANGSTCKYHENPSGYHENCKYTKANKTYKASKVKSNRVNYRPLTYRPVEYHPVKYHPVKNKAVHYDSDVKGVKPHNVDFHAANGHEGKDVLKGQKGPKH